MSFSLVYVLNAWQEIIDKQISQHANYSLKSEYSKEKYKKRKEAKCVEALSHTCSSLSSLRFNKAFTALQPNVSNLIAHHNDKDPAKIMHLRIDSLAQMLTMGNIREGGRYIVAEDCGGLVTGAMLERMGGEDWRLRSKHPLNLRRQRKAVHHT